MKKYILFAAILLSAATAFAQVNYDSLKRPQYIFATGYLYKIVGAMDGGIILLPRAAPAVLAMADSGAIAFRNGIPEFWTGFAWVPFGTGSGSDSVTAVDENHFDIVPYNDDTTLLVLSTTFQDTITRSWAKVDSVRTRGDTIRSFANGDSVIVLNLAILPNWWNVQGNTGTDSTINFIGNNDNVPLIFKVNGQSVAQLSSDGGNAIGANSTAYGFSSIALGESNEANGVFSTAAGFSNQVDADYSSAMGYQNTIDVGAVYSSAIGRENEINQSYGVAIGINNKILGGTSSAFGFQLIANANMCTVIGKYNDTTGSYLNNILFQIGKGNDGGSRSNAMTILNNGNIGIGTNNPDSTLTIQGGFKLVNGSQGAGKVLTTDANGAATWQTPSGGGISALTGDVTASGSGSVAATLATVNSNVGSFGSATQAGTFTVNGKGLITAASNTTITPAVGSITGLGTNVSTWLATPSSANLTAALTDETGTGNSVFSTSPTFTGLITTDSILTQRINFAGRTSTGAINLNAAGTTIADGLAWGTIGLYRVGVNQMRINALLQATNIVVDNSGQIYWTSRSTINSAADGRIHLTNNLASNFTRLTLGSETTAYPAFTRTGAAIDVTLGDGTGFAPVQSLYDRYGTGSPEGVVSAPVSCTFHRTDGGTGTALYVKESGGTGNTGWVAK